MQRGCAGLGCSLVASQHTLAQTADCLCCLSLHFTFCSLLQSKAGDSWHFAAFWQAHCKVLTANCLLQNAYCSPVMPAQTYQAGVGGQRARSFRPPPFTLLRFLTARSLSALFAVFAPARLLTCAIHHHACVDCSPVSSSSCTSRRTRKSHW